MMTIRGVPTYLPPANDDAMMTLRGVPTYLPSRSPKIILRNIGMAPYELSQAKIPLNSP